MNSISAITSTMRLFQVRVAAQNLANRNEDQINQQQNIENLLQSEDPVEYAKKIINEFKPQIQELEISPKSIERRGEKIILAKQRSLTTGDLITVFADKVGRVQATVTHDGQEYPAFPIKGLESSIDVASEKDIQRFISALENTYFTNLFQAVSINDRVVGGCHLVKYEFNGEADLLNVLQDQFVAGRVDGQERAYYSINVRETMEKLTRVGDLLRLAYAGSHGSKCWREIGKVLMNYQGLIKDSRVATHIFAQASLSALRTHVMAAKMTEKDNYPVALKFLGNCQKIAGEMAKEADKLAMAANNLCEESKTALQLAMTDDSIAVERKQAMQKEIREYEAKRKELETVTTNLTEEIQSAKEEEAVIAKKADAADKKAFVLGLVKSVMQPVTELITAMQPAVQIGQVVTKFAGEALKTFVPKLASAVDDALVNLNSDLSNKQQDVKNAESLLASKKQTLEKQEKEIGADKEQIAKLKEEIVQLEKRLEYKRELVASSTNAISQAMAKAEAGFSKEQDRLAKSAETLRDREEKIAKRRAELQKENRAALGDLAKSVKRLQSMTGIESEDLEKAIQSLEVTVKTLGQIVTIFQNTRLFWTGVEKQCKQLADAGDFVDLAGYKDEFMEAIRDSAFCWMALGKINFLAQHAMEQVDNGVDNIMNNLSNKAEAMRLIESLSTKLLTSIQAEVALMPAEEKK